MRKNQYLGIAVIIAMLLAAGNLSAVSAPKKTQLTLSGGFNMFQACGKDSEYVAGENDFPVTPAYKAPELGIGLSFFTSRAFAIGLDVSYGLSAQVDLRDPSDGETIRVDTPKDLVAVLDFCKYFPLGGDMQLFVSAGGGGEYRMVTEKEYISTLGSKIIISKPDKPFSPLAAVGIGFQYMFSDSMGLAVNCRGVYIFRDPAQVLISPALAFVLKF